jgi:hypothetical protein
VQKIKFTLNNFFLIFLISSFNLKADPPIYQTRIISLAGGIGGFSLGAYYFQNPEAYINLVPLVTAPFFATVGAIALPLSYTFIYDFWKKKEGN